MRRARWILAPELAPLTMWCLAACDLMSLSRVPIRSTLRTVLLCAETGLVSGIAFGLLGGRGARRAEAGEVRG